MNKRPEQSHDCKDGTPEEDHDFQIEGEDDPSTNEQMYLKCKYCGKEIDYWMDVLMTTLKMIF